MTYTSDDFQNLIQPDLDEAQEEGVSREKARWYAVQVASGCEKRVKANLEQRVETLDVASRILQVEIPQTPAIKLRKDGSRQNTEEKVFPGYVLIRMIMDDETWQVVKNTRTSSISSAQSRSVGMVEGEVTSNRCR